MFAGCRISLRLPLCLAVAAALSVAIPVIRAAAAVPDRVSAAAAFSVTKIVHPQGWQVFPMASSDNGTVAGYVTAPPVSPNDPPILKAFVWKNNVMTMIPALGGASAYCQAWGVNNNGDVVGESANAEGDTHAFIYHSNTAQLEDLGNILGAIVSIAYGINDAGQVVGQYGEQYFGNAFVWSSANGITDLGPGYANSINASGVVAGQVRTTDDNGFHMQPATWTGGVATILPRLAGDEINHYASDINDSGAVVGASMGTDGYFHAVIWRSGVLTDLGNLQANTYAIATSINNQGQVVGGCGLGAFLWQNGQLTNLVQSVPHTSDAFPGYAVSINNSGQIACQSYTLGSTWVGQVLTPGSTPPPPTDVKLASFTANPGTITLRSQPVPVTFTLGLTAKTKTSIKVPLVIKLNDEVVLGFPVGIGKNKSSASTTLQLDKDWTPGTYSITASYGGVEKTATLVVNPAAPITLKTLSFPSKVKRGKKVKATLTLTDVPDGIAEVKLVLLDSTQTPISLLGVPVEYLLALDRKDTATAKLTIPTLLPVGTYYVSASYGGVTKTIQFQAQ